MATVKKWITFDRTRVESETASLCREVAIKIVADSTASSVEAIAPKVSVASAVTTGKTMLVTVLASVLAAASAMPSYIAVPADQIAFVDLSSLHVRRVPRQTLAPPPLPNLYTQDYQPVPIQHLQQYEQDPSGLLPPAPEAPARLVRIQQQPQPQEPAPQASSGASGASAQLNERPPDFGEFVDFGAHTGDSGAFGWYADYPVDNHREDHSNYRK